jgi:hypothetical protein
MVEERSQKPRAAERASKPDLNVKSNDTPLPPMRTGDADGKPKPDVKAPEPEIQAAKMPEIEKQTAKPLEKTVARGDEKIDSPKLTPPAKPPEPVVRNVRDRTLTVRRDNKHEKPTHAAQRRDRDRDRRAIRTAEQQRRQIHVPARHREPRFTDVWNDRQGFTR